MQSNQPDVAPPGLVLGLDPGRTGAIAALIRSPDGTLDFLGAADMPLDAADAKRPDGAVLAALVDAWQHALVPLLGVALDVVDIAIEEVGAARGQGLSSTFNFGRSAGIAEGALRAVAPDARLHRLRPQAWKLQVRLPRGADADASIAAALRRFPNAAKFLDRKKDHGRAEAMLIALAANNLRT